MTSLNNSKGAVAGDYSAYRFWLNALLDIDFESDELAKIALREPGHKDYVMILYSNDSRTWSSGPEHTPVSTESKWFGNHLKYVDRKAIDVRSGALFNGIVIKNGLIQNFVNGEVKCEIGRPAFINLDNYVFGGEGYSATNKEGFTIYNFSTRDKVDWIDGKKFVSQYFPTMLLQKIPALMASNKKMMDEDAAAEFDYGNAEEIGMAKIDMSEMFGNTGKDRIEPGTPANSRSGILAPAVEPKESSAIPAILSLGALLAATVLSYKSRSNTSPKKLRRQTKATEVSWAKNK